MNLDKPCLCPECKVPMQLSMPCWITPGPDDIAPEIDWESGNKQCSTNWYCPDCEGHHFPLDNEAESASCEACTTGTMAGPIPGTLANGERCDTCVVYASDDEARDAINQAKGATA